MNDNDANFSIYASSYAWLGKENGSTNDNLHSQYAIRPTLGWSGDGGNKNIFAEFTIANSSSFDMENAENTTNGALAFDQLYYMQTLKLLGGDLTASIVQ